MKKTLLHTVVLCFAMISVAVLAGCGGNSAGSTSGTNGTSGGGTTGSSGATPENALLKGQYAFSFAGSVSSSEAPIYIAGSFTADGVGDITTGVEDVNQLAQVGFSATRGVAISGTYSIGSDGRGTLSFTKGVTQTFKFALESGNHGQLIRFDSAATGSGTFDLQTSSAFSLSSLQGSFALAWNGIDSGSNPLSGAGAVSLSSGNFSGTSDLNEAQAYTQPAISGTLQTPDSNGHGTASITYGGSAHNYGYDIISANRVLLIELDLSAGTVGEADSQSSSPSFSGNYTFSLNGINYGLGIVGQLAASGGSITSSDAAENNFGAVSVSTFSGTYGGAAANGRFTMSVTEPSGALDSFVVYLVSSNQAFVMETDTDQITYGEFLAQTGSPYSSSSLTGNYGLNFTGFDGNEAEGDVVGQVIAGGNATLSGGTVDINDEDASPTTFANNAISGGNYSVVVSSTGRSTLSFTAAGTLFTFDLYFVSPNQFVMVEVDDQTFVSIGSGMIQPTIPT